MNSFGYRNELGKYEDVDEDELLASLSSEELQELEKIMAEIDPDEEIPTGLRQENQTAKLPTGTFCREALLKFWEDESQRLLKDNMDECQIDKSEEECGSEGPEDNEEDGDRLNTGCQKEDDRSNRNFVDLSKKNANSSRKANAIHNHTLHHHVILDGPTSNPVDIEKTLENILSNDNTLTEVNLNNIEEISQGVLMSFADALISNTHVEVFSLANTHADDGVALALAKMLKKNCRITNLNVESNFISGKGILALIGSLKYNTTLVELRFQNQRHICGGQVEMEMVKLLRDNTTLLKLGYHFDLPGPRMSATSILTHNQDRHRQTRLKQRKGQDNPETDEPSKKRDNRSLTSTAKETTIWRQSLVSSHLPQTPNQPSSVRNVPTRKIAEMAKQSNKPDIDSVCHNQGKAGHERDKNDKIILQDEQTVPLRRKDGRRTPGCQESMRDDLLAAIRGSSIGTLRKVSNHHS